MTSIEKAKEIAEKFEILESIDTLDIIEACNTMHEWTKENMLEEFETWKDYYLNNNSFKVADALDEIITWFRSPE